LKSRLYNDLNYFILTKIPKEPVDCGLIRRNMLFPDDGLLRIANEKVILDRFTSPAGHATKDLTSKTGFDKCLSHKATEINTRN
jgi:hypothetical protein